MDRLIFTVFIILLFISDCFGQYTRYKDLEFISYIAYYKNDTIPFTGPVVRINRSTRDTIFKSEYKDGLLHGRYVVNFTDGCSFMQRMNCYYERGLMNGPYEEYYENGKIYSTGMMRNNEKDGIWQYYDYTGDIAGQVSYKEGLKHGKYTRWYEDSTLIETGWYSMDKEDSCWTFRIRFKTKDSVFYDTVNGIYKDNSLIFSNVDDAFEKGMSDAKLLFEKGRIYSYGIGIGGAPQGIAIIAPYAATRPRIKNLKHPICRMFDNTEYLKGFRKKSHRMKALYSILGFFTSVGGTISLIAYLYSTG